MYRNRIASRVKLALVAFCVYLVMLSENGQSLMRRALSLAESQLALYRSDGHKQISREFKVAYVHIPKTGGSTIERSALFQEKIKETGVRPSSHWTVEELYANATERELDGDFLTATTVREPCERFISAFQYLKDDSRAQQVREYVERYHIDRFDNVDQYVHFLEEAPEMWGRLKNFFHFTPMDQYVMRNDETFGVDVVMCQEHWNEGVERLFQHLERPVPADALTVFRANNKRTTHCIDLLPKTRQALLREYAMDYCLFGYGLRYKAPGIRRDQCIGSQMDRTAFTMRHQYCSLQIELDEREYERQRQQQKQQDAVA